MFNREEIDRLFSELRRDWSHSPDWETLNRDVHLGISRSDAGVPLGQIDPRAQAIIKKYQANR